MPAPAEAAEHKATESEKPPLSETKTAASGTTVAQKVSAPPKEIDKRPESLPSLPAEKADPSLPALPPVPDNVSASPPNPPEPVAGAKVPPEPAEVSVPPKGTSRREPLVDALQRIIDNHPNEALELLRKYDPGTQEFFLRLLPVMARLTQKSIDLLAASEVAVLNEELQSLTMTLRPHSQLGIDKACFCEWIKSYGIYKPLPEGHAFVGPGGSGTGELVQLYVELRNFACEAKNGAFATRLSSSVEIRDQKGERVWFYQFEDGKQPIRSQTMLHDYFNNYCFYVPNRLPPGTYTLTINVADETRPEQRRVASKSLEFRVTAISTSARGP